MSHTPTTPGPPPLERGTGLRSVHRTHTHTLRGRFGIVAARTACFFSGVIYTPRQVPAPSAAGWLFDLTTSRGPLFVVLRVTEDDARQALSEHLVDIGAVADHGEADQLIDGQAPAMVGVVW